MTLQKSLLNEIFSGKIFTAEFIKKDGSIRKINCRTSVQKYTNGVGMSYNPISKGLIPVFDVQLAKGLQENERNKAFRMINTNTLISITIGGKKYKYPFI